MPNPKLGSVSENLKKLQSMQNLVKLKLETIKMEYWCEALEKNHSMMNNY